MVAIALTTIPSSSLQQQHIMGRPCNHFFSNGQCRAGQNCSFSHDPDDFEVPQKGRITPCRSWTASRTCQYGIVCRFRHDRTFADADAQAARDSLLFRGVKDMVETFHRPLRGAPLEENGNFMIEIRDFKELCSYNCMSSKHPTIAVPGNSRHTKLEKCANQRVGLPPILSLPNHDLDLKQDTNTSGCKEEDKPEPYRYSFEPLIRSLQIMDPVFNIKATDIVTGLGNIRTLFDFCTRGAHIPDGLRIDLELIGSTLFMSRYSYIVDGIRSDSLFSGFGRGFERECIRNHSCFLKDATSYHRVASYDLGNCRLCVQHEADAYRPEFVRGCSCGATVHATTGEPEFVSPQGEEGSDGEKDLHVVQHGAKLSRQHISEIKSRASDSRTPYFRVLPQLWLSGMSNLVFGRHILGLFKKDSIIEEDASALVSQWVQDNQDSISEFSGLLECICQKVNWHSRRLGNRRFALVFRSGQSWKLDMYEREGGRAMLPDALIEEIWQ